MSPSYKCHNHEILPAKLAPKPRLLPHHRISVSMLWDVWSLRCLLVKLTLHQVISYWSDLSPLWLIFLDTGIGRGCSTLPTCFQVSSKVLILPVLLPALSIYYILGLGGVHTQQCSGITLMRLEPVI